ncbi:MAG: hypothetical protein K0Q57_113 [Gammaproteobacteria bacterium]|jgi:hypothetical protein|nr:hypothetical protein [Gammaproteobacteria bacterium]
MICLNFQYIKIGVNMIKNIISLASISLFLTGCGTLVQTTSTAYHSDSFAYQGATYSYYKLPGEKNLEYDHVANLVDAQLQKYGMIRDDTSSQYSIVMVAGVGQPQTSLLSAPVYGQTGYSGASTFGQVNPDGSFYANTMYSPTYGVVGERYYDYTTFPRFFELAIFNTKDIEDKNYTPAYMVSAVSSGSSSNLDLVLPPMIVAVFKKFPAGDGETYSSFVPVSNS